MNKIINEIGHKYGNLTVIKRAPNDSTGKAIWRCLCDCGNEIDVYGTTLRRGNKKSCGCIQATNEIGKKYGHLTVIARAGSDEFHRATWVCECDCENKTIITVPGAYLRSSENPNCGCLKTASRGEEKIKQLLEKNNILFEQEVSFDSLISFKKYKLRFDFCINNSYLIEFDGEQHFKPIEAWGGEENFKILQEHDIMKNKWCKDNNIPLIRIPYYHFKDLIIDDLKLETSNFIVN